MSFMTRIGTGRWSWPGPIPSVTSLGSLKAHMKWCWIWWVALFSHVKYVIVVVFAVGGGPHEMMLNLVSCIVQPCQVCYCRYLCCWWWSTWNDAKFGELHCLCCWWWSMWSDAKFGELPCFARSSMLLTLSLLLVVVHSLLLERYWQKPRSSVSFVIFSISYCAGVTWEAYSGSICVCAISCDKCSAYKFIGQCSSSIKEKE